MRISNPHSGLSAVVYALVDTGADHCAFPESLAVDLGHNFQGDNVMSETTVGVSGATDVYLHTFDISILTPDLSDVFASFENMLISCVPTEIPALLGVANCLDHFVLTIDYPDMEIKLAL
ncbi:MAG: hypothetical protein QGH42_00415 [Kiritimatiellia bacterium]|nr:hypothetical protein [Kiritimatiellia bacterium]